MYIFHPMDLTPPKRRSLMQLFTSKPSTWVYLVKFKMLTHNSLHALTYIYLILMHFKILILSIGHFDFVLVLNSLVSDICIECIGCFRLTAPGILDQKIYQLFVFSRVTPNLELLISQARILESGLTL